MAHLARRYHIRVKHEKTTLFLDVGSEDTIFTTKKAIATLFNQFKISERVYNADLLELRHPADVVLTDTSLIGDHKLFDANDNEVFVYTKNEHGEVEPMELHDPIPSSLPKSEVRAIFEKYRSDAGV